MFCSNCGAPVEDGARFCPACGKPQPVSSGAPDVNDAGPAARRTVVPLQGSVPKGMTGRRVIPTTRAFTHEELLRFMTERWDTAQYNSFVADPALSQYTKRYVVLPATTRYMIIVFSRAAGGLFSREDRVVLSVMNSPAGAGEMMMRAIPTHNAFFGIAKIANTMSAKAEREGPADEILQKYADYMYALLREAGFAR